MTWSEIDHTADAGIEVTADSLEDLFSQAAEAFYSLMFDSPTSANDGKRDHTVAIEGMDLADLSVQWLNELIFIWETEGGIFSPSYISVNREKLCLVAHGTLARDENAAGKVKAATYGGLVLKTLPSFFLRVFLDI